jgi:hypothetical protein
MGNVLFLPVKKEEESYYYNQCARWLKGDATSALSRRFPGFWRLRLDVRGPAFG